MSAGYTLITGASMGIGKAFAEECARRKWDLLLVALPGPELEELAEALRLQYGVAIQTLGLNLLSANASAKIHEWCLEHDYPVDKLINNIGVGGRSDFETCPLDELERMLALNVQAATYLSRLFIDRLKQHRRSYILNVGSAAGFFHVPHKAVYSASKAYLYSLTRSLRSELKPLGIHVALLAPGGADNRSDPVLHRKMNGWLHRNLHHTSGRIARDGLDGLLKGRRVIIPGFLPTIYVRLGSVFPPSWTDAVVGRLFRE